MFQWLSLSYKKTRKAYSLSSLQMNQYTSPSFHSTPINFAAISCSNNKYFDVTLRNLKDHRCTQWHYSVLVSFFAKGHTSWEASLVTPSKVVLGARSNVAVGVDSPVFMEMIALAATAAACGVCSLQDGVGQSVGVLCSRGAGSGPNVISCFWRRWNQTQAAIRRLKRVFVALM